MNKKMVGSLILAIILIGTAFLGGKLLKAQQPDQSGSSGGTSSETTEQKESIPNSLAILSPLPVSASKSEGNTYDSQANVENSQGKTSVEDKKETISEPVVSSQTSSSTVTNQGPGQDSSGVAAVSRSASPTTSSKYTLLSKDNGIYGQFRYRNTSGGRIEIDPQWIAQNIVTIKLPGLNRQVQVNKDAQDEFVKAFNYIKNGSVTINGKEVPLLSLIKSMDGTFVSRHVNWNNANSLSNHSWGTAIDINASDHYRYVNPAKEPNDPNLILWEKAFKPAGFSWGNSYNDAMHFELLR